MNSKNHQRNLLSVVRLYLRFTMMLSMLGTSWFDTNLTMAPLTAEGVHDFIVPHTRLTPCACIFCEPARSGKLSDSTLGKVTDGPAPAVLPALTLLLCSCRRPEFWFLCWFLCLLPLRPRPRLPLFRWVVSAFGPLWAW